MKVVFALLLICILHGLLADQEVSQGSLSKAVEGSMVREVREPGRERKRCGKKCRARKAKKAGKKTDKKPGKKPEKKPAKNQGNDRKKKCGKKCRARKVKKPSKKPSKKSNKKPGRKVKKSKGKKGPAGRQASSCLADVLTKTKKFNKVQTELRMLNRIVGWKKMISGKKANAANSTFDGAMVALNESTNGGTECGEDGAEDGDTKKIFDKLKNCATTAAAKCDISAISLPSEALITECSALMKSFTTDFKKCLVGDSASTSAAQCTCIQGLTAPKDECLDNTKAKADLLAQKNKCTKSAEKGSFGDCRKAEREAAKAANKCRPKTGCKRPDMPSDMTTKAPSVRVNILKQLSQRQMKFNFH